MMSQFSRFALIVLLSLVTVPALSAGRVFFDSFESGTSQWGSDDYRNRCRDVTSAEDGGIGARTGSRFLSCNWNGTVAWNNAARYENLVIPTPATATEIFYRFWVRVGTNLSSTGGGGDNTGPKLLRFYSSYAAYLHTADVNSSGSSASIAWIHEAPGSIVTNWGLGSISKTGWTQVELYFNRSTNLHKIWINNTLTHNTTSNNVSNLLSSQLFLGSNWSGEEGTRIHDATNHVYWDDVEIFSSNGSDATGSMVDGTIAYSGGGTTYTVTPSAGANGTISPDTAQTVSSGSVTSFTVTPSGGYTASVGGTCGGSLVGTTYTTNAITANCTVSATFAPIADTTPPAISSPLPTGEQPYGTTSVTLQVTTNEAATCKYHTSDVAYASMGSTFGSTGGTTHQQTGFATSNGSSYTRYVRCIDSSGNASTASTVISFSVAADTPELILDNTSSGATQSGSWSVSTFYPGYYGSNYHYAPDATGHWFQWSGTLAPGTYQVYAQWPNGGDRPTDSVYQITHSGGTANVPADQTANGGQWNLLGTYAFGSTGTVRLLSSANGTDGTAADAIRFYASAADTTPPTTTISTSDPSAISTDGLTVIGTASDDTAVSGCKYRIGAAPDGSNGTACSGTTSFSCSTSGYASGANTLYVGCYDAAGNYGSDSITVNYTDIILSAPSNLRILN